MPPASSDASDPISMHLCSTEEEIVQSSDLLRWVAWRNRNPDGRRHRIQEMMRFRGDISLFHTSAALHNVSLRDGFIQQFLDFFHKRFGVAWTLRQAMIAVGKI
jgi:hypothetical protein